MRAKHKACDGRAQACSSSLWDLLDLNLQHYIIQLALESRKSVARERYLSIASTFKDFDVHNYLSLPRLAKQQAVRKLKQVVLQIRADEKRLVGLNAHDNDEMLELNVSLQKLIDPIGLGC